MIHFKSNNSVLLRFLLVILFVGYYGSITLFYHAHLVNGVVIVHSHPFSKANDGQIPSQSHQHSSTLYAVIDHLMQVNWEGSPESPSIPEPDVVRYENLIGFTVSLFPSSLLDLKQLRAPPVG